MPFDSNSIHHNRISAVFNGLWPDRVPICEQAFASSVASKILGRQVYTGSTDVMYAEACAWLEGESAHREFEEKLLADIVDLCRYFDFDILFCPWRKYERPTRKIDEYTILYGDPDGSNWEIWKFDPESRTFGLSQSGRPEPTFETVTKEIKTFLNTPRSPYLLDTVRKRAVAEYGNEFVVAGSAGMGIPMQSGWLEATILDPVLIADYVDRLAEDVIDAIRVQYEAGIVLINGGGDFAFNDGPVYSPKFFHDVMCPRWEKIFDYCRELGVYYIMRSDGNLWPVADDLFGWAKPHAYYEVDYDAGMRFEDLRNKFPELVLFGNVSCDLLRRGKPNEIRQRVIECINAAEPCIVIASSNSILHGTPIENVFALYETAKNYR